MAECSSCGAEIVWAKTTNGKAVPLDAKPEKRYVRCASGPGPAEDATVELRSTYVTHFVTCPNATQHRKKT